MHLQVCFQSIFISHEYLSYWIDQQQQMEVFFLHVAIYSNELLFSVYRGEFDESERVDAKSYSPDSGLFKPGSK